MSPLFNVLLRAAKTIDEEIAQALLCRRQIAPLVHRPENVIGRNLPVKGRYQPGEPIVSNCRENLVFFHQHDASNCLLSSALVRLLSRRHCRGNWCNRRRQCAPYVFGAEP